MNNGFAVVYTSNEFEKGYCYVRIGSTWKKAKPYVYTNSQWNLAGASGSIMIPLITSDSKIFYDSNNKEYLVRREN